MPSSPAALEERFQEQVAAADMRYFYKAIQRHSVAKRRVAPLPLDPSLQLPTQSLSASAPLPTRVASAGARAPAALQPAILQSAARLQSPSIRSNSDDTDLHMARAVHRRWAADAGHARAVEQRSSALVSFALGAGVGAAIEAAKRQLPLDFLRQHEMGDVAARESAAVMNRALRRLLSQALAGAWGRWQHWLEGERLRDVDTAARRVQRAYRGSGARASVRVARTAKTILLAKARAKVAEEVAKRRGAVRVITHAFRRYRVRCAGVAITKLVHAVLVVQRSWASKQARRAGWGDIVRHIKEAEASIIMQRFFRGFAGRRKFRKRRQVLNHVKREERFNDTKTTLKANFEMHGAAKRMQAWWVALPWRVRRKRRHLLLYYSMRLQGLVRMWLARRRARQARCRRFGAATPEDMGAMQMQRLARGMSVRKRFGPSARWQAMEDKLAAQLAARFKKTSGLQTKMENGARLVQRVWRGAMARKAYEVKVMKRLWDKVAIIQLAVGRFLKRKRRGRALLAMARWFRMVLAQHSVRRSAAVGLQACWRRRTARTKFKAMRFSLRSLGRHFLPVVRAVAARRKQVRDDSKRMRAAEDAVAGAHFFQLSREDEIRRQVFVTTQIDDPGVPGEAQEIFAQYCAFGQKGNTTRLGVNNFSKLCKECPGLIKPGHLTSQECELIFTKSLGKLASGGNESHLHYTEFVSALGLIAATRLKKTDKWGSKLRGNDAKLVQLLQVYIIQSPTGQKVVKSLMSMSAPGRADTYLRTLAMRMQRAYRVRAAKKRFKERKGNAAAKRERDAEFYAAILFQRFWHRHKARKAVVTQAKLVWLKYLDAETKRPYWYNSRTGTAVWRKPVALGNDDCPNPVKMPPKPDVFTAECKSCAENLATTMCLDCGELHCVDCSKVMHGKGRRHGHEVIKLETCVQCEFQVGCRYCFACKDDYCDTCFEDQHAKGMLQRHEYKPLVAVCIECCKRGARQIVHDGLPDKPPVRNLCNTCTAKARPLNPRALREPLPYHPFKIDVFLAAKKEEQERLAREEAFNVRKREARAKLEAESVTTLQRWFRGCTSRAASKDFVTERKAWMQKRKGDDVKRRALVYRALNAAGMAPELPSDTVFEKVLKRYPARNKDYIVDIVNGEWQKCYQLIVDQENHVKAKPRLSLPLVDLAVDSWRLSGAQMSLALKESAFAAKKKEADKAQLDYRNARSALGKTEEAKNELQQAMRAAKKDADAAQHARDAAKAKYDEVAARSRMRSGPRGMAARIKKVRQGGWPTALRVTAKRSKEALFPAKDGQQNLVKPGQYIRVEGSPVVYRVQDYPDRPGAIYMTYLAVTARWVRLAARLEGLDMTAGSEDLKAVDARTPKWVRDDAAFKTVLIDRAWTYETARDLQVYRLPRLSPYWAAVFALSRFAKASSPSQAAIVGLERFLGWVATKYRGAAELFDEEAAWHQRLLDYAAEKDAQKAAAAHLKHLLEPRVGAVSVLADAKSFWRTVVRVASKVKSNLDKRRAAAAEKARRRVDPLQPFLDSKNQLEVIVAWNDGHTTGAGPVGGIEKPLGLIKVDLDCPASLGRQVVCRYLWPELNALKGRNFFYQIEVKKEKGDLEVSQELSRTLDSLVQQRLNTETRRVEYILVLRPDKDSDAADPIEPWDWEEEAKLNPKTSDPDSPAPVHDEDDEPDSVRFAAVIAQQERHMVELKRLRLEAKLAGLQLDDAEGPAREADSDEEGEAAGEAAGGPKWAQLKDDDGKDYWFDSVSGESTYVNPKGGGAPPAWEQVADDEGKLYYYNNETGESTYDSPY